MSVLSFLSPNSLEIQKLSNVLNLQPTDINDGHPSCYWVSLIYSNDRILINSHMMPLPDKIQALHSSLQNIQQIQSALLSTPFFKNPITLTCLSDAASSSWRTNNLSHIQIFQILASLVIFLKNQLLYASQLPNILPSNRELILSTVNSSVIPLLKSMQRTFSSHVQVLESPLTTSSLPSLANLAALSVLKNPTNNKDFLVTNCPCRDLASHLSISKLSAIIRRAFNNPALQELILPHLSLSLDCSSPPESHTLTLESGCMNMPLFNLLPLSMGFSNSIQLTKLIQEKLSLIALSYPMMELDTPPPVLRSVLLQKMIGPSLTNSYITLQNTHQTFKTAFFYYKSNHCSLLLTSIYYLFTEILNSIKTERPHPYAQINVKSPETQITFITHKLLSIAKNLFKILKNPYANKDNFIDAMNNIKRHLTRKITLLQKVSSFNQEVWLEDFLISLEQTIQSSLSILLTQAEDLKIPLKIADHPSSPDSLSLKQAQELNLPLEIADQLSSFDSTSIVPIPLIESAPIPMLRSCIKKSSRKRKRFSFSESLTQVLEFTPEPYETDPD